MSQIISGNPEKSPSFGNPIMFEDESEWDDDTFEDREGLRKSKRVKRQSRKRKGRPEPIEEDHSALFRPILEASSNPSNEDTSFEDHFNQLRLEYTDFRSRILWEHADMNSNGIRIRPMAPYEFTKNRMEVSSRDDLSCIERLLSSRLKLATLHPYADVTKVYPKEQFFVVDEQPPEKERYPNDVIDALYSITSTPYEQSFASRLNGVSHSSSCLFMTDWDTRTVFMDLCEEIRFHYLLSHGAAHENLSEEIVAPICFGILQAHDVPQVHDLLERTFWEGIDVRDALNFFPERCTVVARFKRLVVGVGFLSAPNVTYITYLAVRAGWENARIATSIVYLLIKANPGKDIILHVSANNPAMILYNHFGFKAEEFIVGFYENYLPATSKSSKNAFRLRLRQ